MKCKLIVTFRIELMVCMDLHLRWLVSIKELGSAARWQILGCKMKVKGVHVDLWRVKMKGEKVDFSGQLF